MQIRPYIKDVVYGANDGIITTFAVVSSVVGARLSTSVILIIGTASLLADGFSMAASDYLASRSQAAVERNEGRATSAARPATSAAWTFVAFLAAGAMPLAPYVVVPGATDRVYPYAALSTAAALFFVGALRARFTKRGFFRSGLEMLLIGGAAAVAAWGIGRALSEIAP